MTTAIHKAKNNSIISIRQFHEGNRKEGDLIVLHPSNIDPIVNHLKKIKEKIIIDEWDIHAIQSEYRKTLSELTAEKMKDIFHVVVKKNCPGCEVDHPSQKHHSCLNEMEDQIEELFYALMKGMDWEKLNQLCCEKTGTQNCILTMETLYDDEEFCNYTKKRLKESL